jgi:hypothetical protein
MLVGESETCTDTKEKPYSCPTCRRRFQRADVCQTHQKTCTQASTAQRESTVGASSRKRARIACDSCRRRKARCDGSEPCRACETSGGQCRYTTSVGSGSPAVEAHDVADTRGDTLPPFDSTAGQAVMSDPMTHQMDGSIHARPPADESLGPMFDPAAMPGFESDALGTTAGQLDVFDFSGPVDNFDLWSMPAMVLYPPPCS